MTKRQGIQKAMAYGRKQADAAITARRRGTGRLRALAARGNGMLLAEGDSWFDYPFYDVLSMLERHHRFRIESVAHKGDNVEGMAYDVAQLTALTRTMDNLQSDGHVPRAILLSGGGNDIAGEEFAVLLNHANSGLPALNTRIAAEVIDGRLRLAMATVIATVTRLANEYFGATIPIVLHGYGYPVPDGRGYLGGAWVLPGPWLEPGFRKKGHTALPTNARVMVDLIDRYNAMLATLTRQAGLRHVRYVDVRPLLSNELLGRRYRRSWENELHPTEAGFALVADAIARAALEPLE